MKTLNLNSEELQTAASMMKVLGHPIRISIIELLDDCLLYTSPSPRDH